ncbi:MAG: hypothetical protein GX608_04175 [Lentisphaerae bacterium]|nr:hypothetical protein [Lentisphaerota bacterium]
MLAVILAVSFISVSLLFFLLLRSLAGGYGEYEERYLGRTAELIQQGASFIPVERLMHMKVISAFLLGVIALVVSSGLMRPVPFILAAAAAGIGAFIPDILIHMKVARRREKFNSQLIAAMNTISNGLRSGFSFLQALDLAARQLPDPAGQEFRLTVREINLGVRIEEALENMNKRLNDADLMLLVAAVRLTIQTGGELPVVFGQLSDTIRERNRIDGKIKALTSQGKLQAIIVVLIPVALGIIIHFINPELMRLMYTTMMGWAMLAAVVVLDVIGFFMIRKIVSIRL